MNKAIMAGAGLVGLLLLGVAVLYFTQAADALPAFLPGHEAGVTRHHTSHGIAALGLAFVSFLVAWFTSGPRPSGQSL